MLAVCLPRHVRQRIDSVFGMEFDLKNRLVLRARTLLAKFAFGIKKSVGRTVEFGGIRFHRMRREAFHIHCCRRREALGA